MHRGTMRGLAVWAAALCLAAVAPSPARAAFHLWSIQQVYSNANGNLQFIELRDSPPQDPFGGQNSVNGMQINVFNVGGTQSNTFTIPGNPLTGSTLDHMLLFGTAGVQAAGGPTPDYILPNNFLFTGGGTISFFGTNSGVYTALPTDGTLARDWTSGNDVPNFETNYGGVSGSITPLPEPTALLLSPLAIGLGAVYRRLSRRRASASQPA